MATLDRLCGRGRWESLDPMVDARASNWGPRSRIEVVREFDVVRRSEFGPEVSE